MEPCPQGIQNVLSPVVLFCFLILSCEIEKGFVFCCLLFVCLFLPAPRQLPTQGLNPGPWAVREWSPNHWTPKDFPGRGFEKLVTFPTHSLKDV